MGVLREMREPNSVFWTNTVDEAPDARWLLLRVAGGDREAFHTFYARFGARAGEENKEFLNAELFKTAFARLLEPYAGRVATLIFEFGRFGKSTFPTKTRRSIRGSIRRKTPNNSLAVDHPMNRRRKGAPKKPG